VSTKLNELRAEEIENKDLIEKRFIVNALNCMEVKK